MIILKIIILGQLQLNIVFQSANKGGEIGWVKETVLSSKLADTLKN